MTTRRDFLDHLDDLNDAGYPPSCWSTARAEWFVSDDLDDQVRAAAECLTCSALTACRAYGLEWPKECGVYGGLTEAQRKPARGRTTTTKEN